MSRYENIQCPVCKNFFADGDDIVVCPDCGTPHHRECYNHIGQCVNRGLHKSGYVFEEDKNGSIEDFVTAAKRIANEQANEQKSENGGGFFPPAGEIKIVPNVDSAYDNDTDTIDGESVGDIAAAVRNNVPRFIKIFKKIESGKSGVFWNWGAFFFGSLYYFYRKMYRQAISLISISVTLILGMNYLTLKYAPKYIDMMNEYMNLAKDNKLEEAQAALLKIKDTADFKNAFIITSAFFGIIFIIRIFEALFADKVYKKTVTELIKNVRTQLDNGATFTSPMADINEMNLPQEQIKRYYLSSKGGVNLFAPMLAFLAVEMLLRVF